MPRKEGFQVAQTSLWTAAIVTGLEGAGHFSRHVLMVLIPWHFLQMAGHNLKSYPKRQSEVSIVEKV